MRTRLKICGITRADDAKTAAGLGVDALGFIFYPKSPRYIAPDDAAGIIKQLPPFITKVGVFVNASHDDILDATRRSGIQLLQLHGSESPAFCAQFSVPVVKAVSVSADTDLSTLDSYRVAGFLLDTWDKDRPGGTGRTFDWSIARAAVDKYRHIILAGGLGPTNIQEALEQVGPYAVDVNSGVEIKPGVKNPQKMREVVERVKRWSA